MPIQNPIIDAGPTLSRAEAKTVVGSISSTIPPAVYLKKVDGLLTLFDQYPQREGQFVFVRAEGALSVSMYIVVLLDLEVVAFNGTTSYPTLVWRKVENWGVVIDPRTGLKKDPNLGFYSTLAS